ncbi:MULTISPECIES: hypothetical protein [Acinetobacter]|uniref:hypothetical protein n=1 Tax=Acinetobacter TaxID=469 RepID=UPI0002BAAE0D|nr:MULTISPECIES: hypothetical protein [Acinetobacter]ATR86784.1 hypothetical protein CTI08_05490 [Acinetobacter baumannii]AYX91693.1 hypothetical protein EG365_02790 [Acinetobacter sp. FDAARGOS_494]EHU2873686.1 hypothetical protein [Acinetobacter baumannii]EHU2968438.1 hypothetical protein [Acinetobacter baumannii]EHU3004898.1 hypothetical protein [Acinetobacter baumannii]
MLIQVLPVTVANTMRQLNAADVERYDSVANSLFARWDFRASTVPAGGFTVLNAQNKPYKKLIPIDSNYLTYEPDGLLVQGYASRGVRSPLFNRDLPHGYTLCCLTKLVGARDSRILMIMGDQSDSESGTNRTGASIFVSGTTANNVFVGIGGASSSAIFYPVELDVPIFFCLTVENLPNAVNVRGYIKAASLDYQIPMSAPRPLNDNPRSQIGLGSVDYLSTTTSQKLKYSEFSIFTKPLTAEEVEAEYQAVKVRHSLQ